MPSQDVGVKYHYDWGDEIQLEKLWPLETSHQVLERIPAGSRVLELGCATGYYGRFLREQRGCSLVGVERDQNAAKKAMPLYEKIVVGNLDNPELLADIRGPFDVIFAVGVLEHLQDPVRCLRQLRPLTRPGGKVIVTLPNIAHWTIRFQLLRGQFKYQDYGILDRTHLRFFNLAGARLFLEQAGLEPSFFSIDPDVGIPWVNGIFRRLGGLGVRLQKNFYSPFPNFFGYQFIFEAHWKPLLSDPPSA